MKKLMKGIKMKIAPIGIAQGTFRKVALVAATIASTIGAGAILTSCANTTTNNPSIDYNDTPVANEKLKREALNMANQDPDVKSGCLGYSLNLLRKDTYHCNDGRIIHWDIDTAIKDETLPDGNYKTSLFEDISKTSTSNNYESSKHAQIAERN